MGSNPFTRTRSLRADEIARFERLASAVADLTDEELHELLSRMIGDARRRRAPGEGVDPATRVEMMLSDVLVTEINHRLGVLHNTRAEMQGGHLTEIFQDVYTIGTWQASCWPEWDGAMCWEGPERDYREDAVEDGRRHTEGPR